jgi:uncharacterized membrane protein
MNPVLLSVCLAFHTLSIVLLIGNFALSALVVLPVLRRIVTEEEQSRLIPALVAKSRPWVLGSILAFIVTRFFMLITDAHYEGFMQITNAWSVWMYTKHIVVLGLIVLGVYLDMGVARRLAAADGSNRTSRLAQFRLINGLSALGGVMIILITAAVQVM